MGTKETKTRFLKSAVSTALVASSFSAVVNPASATIFSDVHTNNPHYENILNLFERNILQGYGDGTFRPNASITRGQVAKMLATTLNLDTKNISNPNFSDVQSTDEFYPYIAALVKAGIVHGYTDQTFKPSQTITRGQMAKILARAFQLEASNTLIPFSDVPTNHEYAPYIATLYEYKVTTGKSIDTYDMLGNVTRGQMASFVVRAENAASSKLTKITGTIENISKSSIVVDGVEYKTTSTTSFLVNNENNLALSGSEITFSVNGEHIQAVDSLVLSSTASSFNGNKGSIGHLTIPETFTLLTNVKAKKISYAAKDKTLAIHDVSTEELYVEISSATASLNMITEADYKGSLAIYNSSIDYIYINSPRASLKSESSNIENVHATKTNYLTLNGDFKNIFISDKMNLVGNASIRNVTLDSIPLNLTVASTLNITNATINKMSLPWATAVKNYNIKYGSSSATNTGGDNSSTGESTDNNNSGATGNTGGTTDNNNGSGSTGNTGGATDNNNGSGSTGNSGGSTENEPITGTLPSSDIAISNNNITVGNNTFTVENEELLAFFTQNEELSYSVEVINNVVTAVSSITINDEVHSAIDATGLTVSNDFQLNGFIASVSNLTTTGHVTINSTFDQVSITDVESDQLIVQTSNSTNAINVSNVVATNIIIDEPIMTARSFRVATLDNILPTLFATSGLTSEIKITIDNGTANELTINRKDAMLDISTDSRFSSISINGDNATINAAIDVANVYVANNVTYLSLNNATISKLELDITQPLKLLGNATIGQFNINVADPNSKIGYIQLASTVRTPTLVKLNGTEITEKLQHPIFEQPSSFEIDLVPSSNFGYYTLENYGLNANETLKYVQVKEGATYSPVQIGDTLANGESYANSPFLLYGLTDRFYAYKVNAANQVLAVTSVAVPKRNRSVIPVYNIDDSFTFKSTYEAGNTLAETYEFIYIFNKGNLVYRNDAPTNFTWKSGTGTNALNTVTIPLSPTANVTGVVGITIVVGPETFIFEGTAATSVKTLKNLASIAKERGKPELIQYLLADMLKDTNVTMDGLFFEQYVNELVNNGANYTSIEQVKNMVSTINSSLAYDPQATIPANELALANDITFSYTNEGIVEAQIRNGQVLFVPKSAGATTVIATDKVTGDRTFIDVSVDSSLKVTSNVLKLLVDPALSIIEGSSVRIATIDNINYAFPQNEGTTVLAGAYTNLSQITTLKTITINKNADNVFTMPTTLSPSTPQYYTLAQVGLTATGTATTTDNKIANALVDTNGILLYPLGTGATNVVISNTNGQSTAIYTEAATNSFTKTEIAQSKSLNITADLKLPNINSVKPAITNTKLHAYYADDKFTVFGSDEQQLGFKVTALNSTSTLVNVESTKDAITGQVTINDPTIVATSLETIGSDNNANATVNANTDSSVIRMDGLTAIAQKEGSSRITLSNGNQYDITVSLNGTKYEIVAVEVVNAIVRAEELGLNDIYTATETATVATDIVNGQLIITPVGEVTTPVELVITDSSGQKTVIYVTNVSNNVTYTIAEKVLTANELGLTDLDVVTFNATSTARALIKTDSVTNTKTLHIYGYGSGYQTFRVTDSTGASTLLNAQITRDTQFRVNASAVTHTINSAYTLATTATNNTVVRIGANRQTLYAVGTGTAQLALSDGKYYEIEVSQNANGQYVFSTPIIIEKVEFTASDLGMSSISTVESEDASIAKTEKSNTKAVISSGINKDITRVIATSAAGQTFIHVNNKTSPMVAQVEKSNMVNVTNPGLTNISSLTQLDDTATRPYREGANVTAYILSNRNDAYKVTDTNGLVTLLNVKVTEDINSGLREAETSIVEGTFEATAQILEGSSIRLHSTDQTKFFAVSTGTSKVQLANGEIYEVKIEVKDGLYKPQLTKLASTTPVTATELGLSGNLSFTGNNTSIANATVENDTLKVYGVTPGLTSFKVTDASNNSVWMNVTVGTNNTVTLDNPKAVTLTTLTNPVILDGNSSSIRIDGNNIYALAEGTVRVRADDKVYNVEVKKVNNHYQIEETEVSSIIYNGTDLDLTGTLTVEGNNTSVTTIQVQPTTNEIVAYANAKGTSEITVTDGVGAKAIIRLTVDDTNTLTGSIAVTPNALPVANYGLTTVSDVAIMSPIVRFTNGNLYALTEGRTSAKLNNTVLTNITVARSNGLLTASASPITKNFTEADLGLTGNLTVSASDNIHTTTNAGLQLYAKALGQSAVTVSNGTLKTLINTNVTESNNHYILTANTVSKSFADATTVTTTATTNANIVRIAGKTVFATGVGTTQVNVDGQIVTVIVTETANGYTIGTTNSQSVTFNSADAHLSKITNFNILEGDTFVRGIIEGNNLVLYATQNGPKTAKVAITGPEGDAVIYVAVNENGVIQTPSVAKLTTPLTDDILTSKTVTNPTVARGVISGNELHIYALTTGSDVIQIGTEALVNVSVTENASGQLAVTANIEKETIATNDLRIVGTQSAITLTNDATNAYIYAKGTGTALLKNGSKLYTATVSTNGKHYDLALTNVNAVEIDLPASYTLQGESVGVVEDISTNKLVIYSKRAGTSRIKLADKVYYVKVNADLTIDPPVIATVDLSSLEASIGTFTIASGSSISAPTAGVVNVLNEGTTAVKGTNGVANVHVTLNTNGQYDVTYNVVSKTLKETATFTMNDSAFKLTDNILYALDATSKKTFLSPSYYIEAVTTLENNAYTMTVNEYAMKKLSFADKGITGETPTITVENEATVRAYKDGKNIIVYALATGSTPITVSDGTNSFTMYASVNSAGSLTITLAGQENAVTLADLGLASATGLTVTSSNPTAITAAPTETGINLTANTEGYSTITVKQGNTIAYVNVRVIRNASNQLVLSQVEVVKQAAPTQTVINGNEEAVFRKVDGIIYAIAEGSVIYELPDTNEVKIITVSKNANGFYEIDESIYPATKIAPTDVDISTIQTATATQPDIVGTFFTNGIVYVYGKQAGQTDITLSDSSGSQSVVHVTSGTTVTTAIPTEAVLSGYTTWTGSDKARISSDGTTIYALAEGKTTLTATDEQGNTLITANIERVNNQFTIDLAPVRLEATGNLSGATVVAGYENIIYVKDGYIYARKEGTAQVTVNSQVIDVHVTNNRDGSYSVTTQLPKKQVAIPEASLGLNLTTSSSVVVNAISGTNVVSTQIVNDELIILAEAAGEVELVIDGQTVVHVKVNATVDVMNNQVLNVTEKIAKTDSTTFTNPISSSDTNIIRTNGNIAYLLGEGTNTLTETTANGNILHTAVVSKVNHQYTLQTTEVSKPLIGSIVDELNTGIARFENNKLYAIGEGQDDFTLDGKTYRVTVTQTNGIYTMDVQGITANTLDVSSLFSTITSVETADGTASTLATLNFTSPVITIDPIKAGEEILYISDGQKTVQARLTISGSGSELIAEATLIKATITTETLSQQLGSTASFYPGAATPLTSGIVNALNGSVTIYPGENETTDIVISGNGKQAIYRVAVTGPNNFTIEPLQTNIPLTIAPTILGQRGTAIGQVKGSSIDVKFVDDSETIFIVKGEDNSYKRVEINATAGTPTYTIASANVNSAHSVTGPVTNIEGPLYTIVDGNQTIIYTDTPNTTGAYKVNDQLFNVTIDADRTVTATAVTGASTGTTSGEFISGDDVVSFEAGTGNGTWKAKNTGSGVYKLDGSTYVKVDVSPAYVVTETPLPSHPYPAIIDMSLVSAPNGIYLDGNTLFGTEITASTEPIVVSGIVNGGTALYVGTADNLSSLQLKEYELSSFTSWNTNPESTNQTPSLFRISDDGKLYPLATGTETITFTGPSGVTKEITFTIDAAYNVTATVGEDIIAYTLSEARIPGESTTEQVMLTFHSSVNVAVGTAPASIATVSANGNQLTLTAQDFQSVALPVTLNFTFTLPLAEFTNPITVDVSFTKVEGQKWTSTLQSTDRLNVIFNASTAN